MLEHIDTADFKNEFWAWFDTLPKTEKQKFWYYGSDMAEIYFYNKFYARREKND